MSLRELHGCSKPEVNFQSCYSAGNRACKVTWKIGFAKSHFFDSQGLPWISVITNQTR